MDDNGAAVSETARFYPSEHRTIVAVCVDAYVYALAKTKIEGGIGDAVSSVSRGNAVDGAVGIVVGPFAVDNIVRWVFAYDKGKDTDKVVTVEDGVVIAGRNVGFDY